MASEVKHAELDIGEKGATVRGDIVLEQAGEARIKTNRGWRDRNSKDRISTQILSLISPPFSLSVPLSLLLLPLLLTLLLEVPDSLSIPGKEEEEIPQSFPHTQCKFSSVSLLVPLLPLLINFCYLFFDSCKFSCSYFSF